MSPHLNPSQSAAKKIRYSRPADTTMTIYATRGPFTRELLDPGSSRGAVFGDPLWLLPRFHPAPAEKRYELGVILHLSELTDRGFEASPREDHLRYRVSAADSGAVKLINTVTAPTIGALRDRLDDILSCKRIVSTSLHGMVFAESYGIPCLYFSPRSADAGIGKVDFSDENAIDLRFNDLYRGLGYSSLDVWFQPRRAETDWSDLIAAIDRTWFPKKLDENALIEAFPIPVKPLTHTGRALVGYQIPDDTELVVHAVRGRRTAAALRQRGIAVGDAYGDPVWFLPKIFPDPKKKIWELGVIVHISELDSPTAASLVRAAIERYKIPPELADQVHVINTYAAPNIDGLQAKVEEIVACRRILSTSLHGMVIAEAYGIPCAWFATYAGPSGDLPIDGELAIDHRMKDFYSGVDRDTVLSYLQPLATPTDWADAIRFLDVNWKPLTYSGDRLFERPSAGDIQSGSKTVDTPYVLVDVSQRVADVISAAEEKPLSVAFGHARKASSSMIGIGDIVTVSIWEASENGLFSSGVSRGGGAQIPEQPVSESGMIVVPYAGTVRAAGRSPQQVKAEIEKALSGMAVEPQVLVNVVKNNSNTVTVTGEVASSGRIPLTPGGERLLDVIATAGGPRVESHQLAVQITRGMRTETLAMEKLISDPRENIYVQPNDVITLIRQPRSFTVFGATMANASVQFDESQLYLNQALAKVGGLNDDRANAKGVFIYRRERLEEVRRLIPTARPMHADGTVNVIYQIDLKDPAGFFIMKSFKVANGDLIYIANSLRFPLEFADRSNSLKAGRLGGTNMKSDGALLKRLDEVRPGKQAAIVPKPATASLPQKRPAAVPAPARKPPAHKPVVTYKVHGAIAKAGLQQWGKWIFFFLAVIVPTIAGGIYFALFATPQYVSEFRFSVRPNIGAGSQTSAAVESMLAMSNAYIVSDYVGSRDAAVALDGLVNLRELYSREGTDYFSRLGENASVEKLVDYWNSRISTSYDITTGINTVAVSAFSPEDAHKVAEALKVLCEKLVNQISDDARRSQMEFARTELERSEARLKDVRRQETELRTNQKSIDARKEADGRLQLNIKLRGELATLQSQYDSLTTYMDPKSPRLSVIKNQIKATQDQIAQLQNQVGQAAEQSDSSGDMPNAQAVSRYDQLQTDIEIASKLYESSLTNYEAARAQANNTQIYLATYVQPGLPEIASYPRAFFDTFLVFLSACGIWVVLTLVYFSIRDHVRLRNSKHAFMQLFDLLEALVFILAHWIIFTFLHRQLLIGDSLLMFITTGIFPVLFFRTMSIRAATAIEASKSVTAIPYVEAIDYSLARTFVEFLAFSLMFILFFAMIAAFQLSKFAIPYNPRAIVEFAVLVSAFSFGIGLINSFLTYLFPLWKFAWAMISRVQIFFSAVFYIPEYMPPQIKELVSYNPIMHLVSLFRIGFYPTYPTHLFSMTYIAGWACAALLIGLALERALRNHRTH
eukprot:g25212.t1